MTPALKTQVDRGKTASSGPESTVDSDPPNPPRVQPQFCAASRVDDQIYSFPTLKVDNNNSSKDQVFSKNSCK